MVQLDYFGLSLHQQLVESSNFARIFITNLCDGGENCLFHFSPIDAFAARGLYLHQFIIIQRKWLSAQQTRVQITPSTFMTVTLSNQSATLSLQLRVMDQFTLTTALAILSSLLALSQIQIIMAWILLSSGVLAWALTRSLIPKVSQFMLKKRIFGLDINKKGSKAGEKEIPECVGFAAAVAFGMIGMGVTLILRIYSSPQNLTTHIAIFTTIFGTILLGFADDMLDLPWRYKLLFPFFIVLPLICVYTGITHVEVIWPFSAILGDSIELGYVYLLYVTLLGIYQTNTINIYAGINGLQVGQSIVAASGMLIYFAVDSHLTEKHADYTYSIYLLVTFLGTTIALMRLNAYPAKVFIGDTLCYFGGIVLAISAIWGQIPIICHWFLLPQLINFLYSVPQLFGYYECPRHRLTTYNPKTDKLHAIPTNMNLLNLSLRILGPTNEGVLCFKLLAFQICCCLIPSAYLVLTHQ